MNNTKNMGRYGMVLILLIMSFTEVTQAQTSSNEEVEEAVQIKTALLPIAEKDRASATVYGYQEDGTLKILKSGDGNMICIGDNPKKKGISVSCYPKSLEKFMARGRELNDAGYTFDEKVKIRGDEVRAGKIKMPKDPSMLSVCFGEEYDPATGEIKDAKYRYVIYSPFATSLSTGLPDTPQPGGRPWLMDAGTHRAHIMVGPFKSN